VPPGYRIGLSVRGTDYQYGGPPVQIPGIAYTMAGVGGFVHDHPHDRPGEVFGGKNTLHFDAEKQPYVLLPIIPPR
jgi:hypothetical protein